ncbi:MAG: hypothetical protein WD771_10015 [Gemmatimonadaceae bacterium]
MRSIRLLQFIPFALLLATPLAAPLSAQVKPTDGETEAESRARLARRTAGVTVGLWDLRGVEPGAGVDVSTLPIITGFMRKGLDARLALENSVGVWRRVQSTASEEVQSWIIAQTTAIRFFPATDAGATVEPWVMGGAGVSIGIDDRETSGGLLGGAGSSGVQLIPGFSLQAGTGVEWWFSQSLALNAGARFQWTRFLDNFGGERTYQGPSYDLGLTYKFQYR